MTAASSALMISGAKTAAATHSIATTNGPVTHSLEKDGAAATDILALPRRISGPISITLADGPRGVSRVVIVVTGRGGPELPSAESATSSAPALNRIDCGSRRSKM